MRLRTPVVALAVLATTIGGAGCGPQPGGGSAQPATLQLVDGGGAPARAMGVAEPAPGASGAGSPYVLRATLPTATPAPAAVWRLPRATGPDVVRVASALGATAAPTAVSGGWVVRAGSRLLTLRADSSWSLGTDCMPNAPLEQESLQVACGTAVPTPAEPLGPTAAGARQLAAPMLSALGWSAGDIDVAPGRPTTTVTARRAVDGLDTADWTTTLSFTTQLLDSAYGWTTTPTRGPAYPLISAADAFRALAAEPRPMMPELCRLRTDGKPGCEPPAPVVITGARLGLALRHEPRQPVLVPAWLFDVAGGAQPLAVVAVAPHFLATPPPVPMGRPNPATSAVPPGSQPASPPAG
jgi:hypothetical protein